MKRRSMQHWLLAGAIGVAWVGALAAPHTVVVAAGPGWPPAPASSAASPYNPNPVVRPPAPAGVEDAVIIMPSMPITQAPANTIPVPAAPPVAQMTGVVETPAPPVVGADAAAPGSVNLGARGAMLQPPVEPRAAFPPAAPAVPSAVPPAPPVGETLGSREGFPRAEPVAGRRSFVDLSAAPCFGHAPDYSWVSGQVEHSRTAKEWRVRYASVDEVDRFGGRVALVENQHVSYLAEGQYVRVRGHLVNPDDAGGHALYRIESFTVLQDANGAEPTVARP
jgi:hypothetical protein